MGVSLPGAIMKIYWVGAFLVAGCVTPQTMRARAPDFSATSSRSLADVTGCIGAGYAKAVSVVPITQGTRFITRGGTGITDVMVEVVDEGDLRKVSFFSRQAPISLSNKPAMIARLKACL